MVNTTWGIISGLLSSKSAIVELNNPFINMEFDLITSEQHNWSTEITSNPVEDGSNVADHIKLNPDTLEISGIISNASLSRWKGRFIEKLFDILDKESNVQRAFDQLRKLLETRQPLTIYTRYRTYPDMVLTSLSIPRVVDSGDAIEFSASFNHIKRVKTITVDAEDAGINPQEADSEATNRKSQKLENGGNVNIVQHSEQVLIIRNETTVTNNSTEVNMQL